MIIVRLQGGLGNQMFQYAAGRRLALQTQQRLVLDLSYFDLQAGNGLNAKAYELSAFNVCCTAGNLRASFIKRLWLKFRCRFGIIKVVKERAFSFNSWSLLRNRNTLLDGFWQSEKYFSVISQIILNDFTFRQPLDDCNAGIAELAGHCNAVSLHIRRGDYITSVPTYRDLAQTGYYEKAIAMIAGAVENPVFFIFSDDIAWSKSNIDVPYPHRFIDHNQDGNNHLDMRLMGSCKHHIIANSSFSWWGAWLNRHPGKIVIAPSVWFNDPSIDTADLIPPTWHTI